MHKNYKLMLMLGGLLVVSLALRFSGNKRPSSGFRVDLFSVSDTAAVQSILLKNGEIEIARTAQNSWKVNDQYGLDPSLKTVLLAVLNQVTIKRPVSKIQQEEIATALSGGTRASVTSEGGNLAFYAGGNPARTQSYFMLEGTDQPYIVEIPGYRNYISGLFELTELQWRDRRLFNTHWRSLQSLKVSYPDKPSNNLHIYFEDEFFKIEGLNAMDTTALMTYLEPFQYFEANEFIAPGFSPLYDSLSKTQPLAVIELNEINADNNQVLSIFPKLEMDNYLLTANKDGELSLVDFGRVRGLLVRRGDF